MRTPHLASVVCLDVRFGVLPMCAGARLSYTNPLEFTSWIILRFRGSYWQGNCIVMAIEQIRRDEKGVGSIALTLISMSKQ
jgi:hypothetical protein